MSINDNGRVNLVVGLLMLAGSATVNAGGDCWVDVYPETGFQGTKVRIEGPAQLPNLRSLGGSDWSNRIDSLIVGPKAVVKAYHQEGFRGQPKGNPNHPDALKAWGEKPIDEAEEVSFGPGQKHHHLGELDFHHNINSLKVDCAK